MINQKRNILQSQSLVVKRTVAFDTNVTATIDSVKVADGNRIPAYRYPPTITQAHYTFVDWYHTPMFTTEFDFSSVTIDLDKTLHAKWIPPGEAVFTTPGLHTWTPPAGVTSINVLAIGAGGSGACAIGTGSQSIVYGGGGGALAYSNKIDVNQGQTYYIYVGHGGSAVTRTTTGASNGSDLRPSYSWSPASAGGSSYFHNDSTPYDETGSHWNSQVIAEGGSSGAIAQGITWYPYYEGTSGGAQSGGDRVPLIFNSETNEQYGSGGSSAAGYTADGVRGGYYATGSNVNVAGVNGQGGSGASGHSAKDGLGKNGGGTGVYGTGTSGSVQTGNAQAGSGGNTKDPSTTPVTKTYGAGGASIYAVAGTASATSEAGGPGIVRIVWGIDREFPSTAVLDTDDNYIL